MKNTFRRITMLSVALLPAQLFAGAYGESAVKDASVSNYAAAQATVYCAKMNQDIPESLASQMDCGGVRHVVKRQRGLKDIFGPPRNSRRPNVQEDNDGPILTNLNPKKRPPVSDDGPKVVDNDDAPPPSASSIGKWERLGQLGVTRQNFNQQSTAFRNQFNSYFNTHGGGGNWSSFNPSFTPNAGSSSGDGGSANGTGGTSTATSAPTATGTTTSTGAATAAGASAKTGAATATGDTTPQDAAVTAENEG